MWAQPIRPLGHVNRASSVAVAFPPVPLLRHGSAARETPGARVREMRSSGSRSPAFCGRRVRHLVPAIASAVAFASVLVTASPNAGASGIGGDKTKINALEQRIASQGAQVQSLVYQYDQVAARMYSIRIQILEDRAHLVADRRAQSAAQTRLRHWVTDAYVNAESQGSGALAPFTKTSSSSISELNVYLGVASGNLDAAMANLKNAEYHTSLTANALQSVESQTAATLSQLGASRQAAQGALANEDAALNQMNANLLALVTAANLRRAQAEKQREEAKLAAAQQSLQQGATLVASAPTVTPSPGGYANPLRAVSGLTPERIDQGVDFGGYGPIYAIGDGTVISTFNGGWPGGTFISYRLTNGPATGLVVYAAEDIEPRVQIGQSVTANTVIGQMYEGPEGIETGWADGSGNGTTLAAVNGQFDGGNSTAFGANFSQLLTSLGAPGGVLQGGVTSSLPAGWPKW